MKLYILFCLFFALLCGAVSGEEESVPPIKKYALIGGGTTRFDSLSDLTGDVNGKRAADFAQCLSNAAALPDNLRTYSCTLFTIVQTVPDLNYRIVNHEPIFYFLKRNSMKQVYPPYSEVTREDIGSLGAYVIHSCPAGYHAITEVFASNSFLTKCVKYVDYYVQETPLAEGKCSAEGNPCNPLTGGKFEVATDYASPTAYGLSFRRHYSSSSQDDASASEMGVNWKHNYFRRLELLYLNQARTSNGSYDTRAQACVGGWHAMKSTFANGAVQDATSRLANETCEIVLNNKVVAEFETHKKDKSQPISKTNESKNYIALVKSSGERYLFRKGSLAPLVTGLTLEQTSQGHTVEDQDGTREYYDLFGKLTKIEKLGGGIEFLEYALPAAEGGDDNAATLDKVSNQLGQSIYFTYNSDLLSKVTTPDGDINFTYNELGNVLSTVSYPDGSNRQYHYENTTFPSHLTGITDESGNRYATWAYDGAGNVISSEHGDGVEKVTLDYKQGSTTVDGALLDRRTYKFSIERGARRVTEITGDECRTCGNGFMKTRTYDANGFLDGYTDWEGNKTSITNNSRGLPTQRTDAVGTAQARTTDTTWHDNLNLPLIITEPKRRTTLTYTTTGQLSTRTVTDLATAVSRTVTYTYHPLGTNGGGLVATINGPRTDVDDITRYAYNSQSDLISITNALGHVTQITDHDPSGRPLSLTDANGVITTLKWDLRGRLTQSTTDNHATTYDYDAVGQLTRVTQADGTYLNYDYDNAHRLIEISDNLDNKITYTLDKMGNRTETITADANNTITLKQTAVFDKLSRLKQALGGNGQSQTLNYDDNHNLLDSTDAKSRQSQSDYDALDRLIKRIDPDTKETRLDYDDQDNLTQVTDARGLETIYVYNGFGEVTSQTSPDTGTTTYTYDSAGNAASKTDARGVTITYTYDALSRLTTVDYADDSLDVTHHYDEGTNSVGRLTSTTDASGKTTYTYDARDNLLSQTVEIGSISHTTAYTYNEANRLSGMTYPSGNSLLYQRASNGEINQIIATVGGTTHTLLSDARYKPFGPLEAFTFGNGLSHVASFDESLRLTGQTTTTVQDNLYDYNTVDNLASFDNALNTSLNQVFTYNTLDRLTDAQGDYGVFQYDFDAVGNRIQKTEGANTDNYTYGTNSHHLQNVTGANATRYQYDANGNTTDNGRYQFIYGDDNRLHQATQNGISVGDYTYNSHGQRTLKVTTSGTTRFHYNQNGNLIAESDEQGRVQRETVWFNGAPYALLTSPQAATPSNQITFSPLANDTGSDLTLQAPNAWPWKSGRVALSGKQLNYIPKQGFTGQDKIWYVIEDAQGRTNWGEITLNVSESTAASPVANPDTAMVTASSQVTISPLANDVGSGLTLEPPNAWSWKGGQVVSTGNQLNYTPKQGFTGQDKIWYTIEDAQGRTNWGEITLTVSESTAAAPVANPDTVMVTIANQLALRAVYYIHNNHLGTPEAITDQQQSVVWRANYSPYGDAQITTETIQNNVRLPGQYFDAETNLHYNYFRYYDPTFGRYVTSDPIGLRGGINTYGYVGGNPTKYTDPLGLNPALTLPARGGMAIGGAINTVTNYAFGLSLSGYLAMTAYDWLHPENVVNPPLPFNPNMYNSNNDSGESCDASDNNDYDEWEDKWPEDLTPLKDRRRRNKERGQKPKNPEEREIRQRDNEDKKRRSGRGGADPTPTGDDW